MDPASPSPAERLPGLYRAILDRIAELEGRGERAEAARIRSAAIRIYSRSWDEGARRSLEAMLRRTDRSDHGEMSRPGLIRRPAATL